MATATRFLKLAAPVPPVGGPAAVPLPAPTPVTPFDPYAHLGDVPDYTPKPPAQPFGSTPGFGLSKPIPHINAPSATPRVMAPQERESMLAPTQPPPANPIPSPDPAAGRWALGHQQLNQEYFSGARPHPNFTAPIAQKAVNNSTWLGRGFQEAQGLYNAGNHILSSMHPDSPLGTRDAISNYWNRLQDAAPRDPTKHMEGAPTPLGLALSPLTASEQVFNGAEKPTTFERIREDQIQKGHGNDFINSPLGVSDAALLAPAAPALASAKVPRLFGMGLRGVGGAETVSKAAPIVGDALKAAPALGAAAAKAPLIGRAVQGAPHVLNQISKYEPITGIGAMRSTLSSVANAGRGVGEVLYGAGKALVGSPSSETLRTGLGRIGLGMRQGTLAAPQSIIPSIVSGAILNEDPSRQSDIGTTHSAPGGSGFPIGLRGIAAPYHRMYKQVDGGYDDRIPSTTDQLTSNLGNTGRMFSLAKENVPAARRVFGNASSDAVDAVTKFESRDPKNVYEGLEKRYAQNNPKPDPRILAGQMFGLGAAPGMMGQIGLGAHTNENEQIRGEVEQSQYRVPSRPGSLSPAEANLIAEGLKPKIDAQFPEAERPAQYEQARQRVFGRVQGMPFATQRDLENARAGAGQIPTRDAEGKANAFNASLDQIAPTVLAPPEAQAQSVGSPMAAQPSDPGVAQAPPAGPLAIPADPGAAPTPPATVLQSDPKFQETAAGVGKNLTNQVEAAGGIETAIAKANAAPPPSGFEQYWEGLDPQSKMLAIAGLSIAAISAFKSMFAGKDDEEESWIMKVLPYLGIGAAAWGLGGGTIGLSEANLPSMGKYKELGNAAATFLGS